MSFTGAAAVAGVIGWPVSHSRSPVIHNHWLDRFGIDGVYVPLAVPPDRVESALRALPALGIRGVNVTLPHKQAAFAVMDETDPAATRMKAVNTVVVRGDGSLFGRNTDSFGFVAALGESCPDWSAARGPAVVLGAGGAARALVAGLRDAGVREIRVANRTPERARMLALESGSGTSAAEWGERAGILAGAALLVNATSLGMKGREALDIDLSELPSSAVVCDIVYAPLKTALLRAAEARGNPSVDGLGMLLHQARPGFAAWFGVDPKPDRALRDLVAADLDAGTA